MVPISFFISVTEKKLYVKKQKFCENYKLKKKNFLSDNLKTCNFLTFQGFPYVDYYNLKVLLLKFLIKIFREKTLFSEKKVNFSEKLKKIDDVVVLLKNTLIEFFLQPCNRIGCDDHGKNPGNTVFANTCFQLETCGCQMF